MDQDHFDPWTQNATILLADGKTPLDIPLAFIDALNRESINSSINYGSQIGATFIVLITILILTPASNFGRPSNLLHMACLATCLIRNVLLACFYPSVLNSFYPNVTGDLSAIPHASYLTNVVSTVFALLLTMTVEAALMNQAWTMVALWPELAKYALAALSAIITLMTVGWKLAYAVVQIQGLLNGHPAPEKYFWVIKASVITNILSISWFCAIFNIKLVVHLITNRGILPKDRALSPMEILIMTNGVLLVVPVLFAGLEWGSFANFEPASLSLTLVAIILPMGTLAAQRIAHSHHNIPGTSRTVAHRYGNLYMPGSSRPLKPFSYGTSTVVSGHGSNGDTGTTLGTSISATLSRAEAGLLHGGKGVPVDPIDMELQHIDSDTWGSAPGVKPS